MNLTPYFISCVHAQRILEIIHTGIAFDVAVGGDTPAILDGRRCRPVGRAQFRGEGDAVFANDRPEEHVDGAGLFSPSSEKIRSARSLTSLSVLMFRFVVVIADAPVFDDKCRGLKDHSFNDNILSSYPNIRCGRKHPLIVTRIILAHGQIPFNSHSLPLNSCSTPLRPPRLPFCSPVFP